MQVWETYLLNRPALQVACYLNANMLNRTAFRCVVTVSLQCQQMLTASAMHAMLHNEMMLTLLSKAGSHSMGAPWSPWQMTRRSLCNTANALTGKVE